MNEKIKKVFAWIAGVAGVILAVLCGKWRRDANSKRVSDAKDSVADGRQTVDGIRERNQDIEREVGGIRDASEQLETRIRESSDSVGRTEQSLGDAHSAIRFGLEVLENAENRNKGE